ncbi:MAG: acetyltransferase [Acetobacteraceae bacterium]|nr:acetyltransferase [Acetobacteraceae bacterium]
MPAMSSARQKSRKLVIVGDSAFAEIADEYFRAHTDYSVVAFSVERAYLKRDELHGRPVVPFETLEDVATPADHDVFVAVTYVQLNRLRTRLAAAAKQKGYRLASYISPNAFVYENATLGEHCFIFENNVVQPFVSIGDNVVLWSGNHIGHHSVIGPNVFVSSHVVVSGFCNVGRNCFFGVNSSVANNVTIAPDCWIGAGAVIGKDTAEGELYRSSEPTLSKVSAPRFFRVQR